MDAFGPGVSAKAAADAGGGEETDKRRFDILNRALGPSITDPNQDSPRPPDARGAVFSACLIVSCRAIRYNVGMKFRHSGLRRFWERGDASRLNQAHAPRIIRLLDMLDDARTPEDMEQPGLWLHQLTGNRRGVWSIRVSGNWRITFRFEAGKP